VSQALMKIAKHCHEECASDVIIAQGALLGLVVEDCLEITNCFAFPKSVDESINDGKSLLVT
jgi:translation initiation factor 3 subunit H